MLRKTLVFVCASLFSLCSGRFTEAGLISLDFTNSTATFNGGTTFSSLSDDNNLVIRWGSIASLGGADIDLVATVTGGTYEANNIGGSRVHLNGLSGPTAANYRFGRINLRADRSANFTFTLVDPSDSDKEVVADFNFSVLDLDTGLFLGSVTPVNGMESVQLLSQDGTVTWETTANTELSSTYQPTTPAASWAPPVITPTQPFFGATTSGTGADNPRDPLNLTDQQINRTVSFSFQDTSTFTLRLGLGPVDGDANDGGRNFLFDGDVAAVPEPASITVFSLLATSILLWRRRRHRSAIICQ